MCEITISRAELEARTNRLARAYLGLGVTPGSFVTIGLPNGIEWFEATIAVWKLGATPAPVSAKLPRLELDAIVELANPSLVVGLDAPGRTCVPIGFVPDPELSDAPLPVKVAAAWKAPTSGGSTGRPKLIVSGGGSVTEGVSLTAISYAQWDQTQHIPVSDIQPGDLVFYFGSGAHHVAIYIGGGLIIHAPHTGDVVKIAPIFGSPSGAARPW